MRDLGAVLDHEGPLAPSCERSSAVASQDHQRGVAMCRRDEPGAMGLSGVEAHYEAALIDRAAYCA
jgi:hypothetical protein